MAYEQEAIAAAYAALIAPSQKVGPVQLLLAATQFSLSPLKLELATRISI